MNVKILKKRDTGEVVTLTELLEPVSRSASIEEPPSTLPTSTLPVTDQLVDVSEPSTQTPGKYLSKKILLKKQIDLE